MEDAEGELWRVLPLELLCTPTPCGILSPARHINVFPNQAAPLSLSARGLTGLSYVGNIDKITVQVTE